jgi:hypothetical protein
MRVEVDTLLGTTLEGGEPIPFISGSATKVKRFPAQRFSKYF